MLQAASKYHVPMKRLQPSAQKTTQAPGGYEEKKLTSSQASLLKPLKPQPTTREPSIIISIALSDVKPVMSNTG